MDPFRLLNKEFVYVVHQFLKQENFMETVHQFEKETACYFDLEYVELKALGGMWDQIEDYLSGFIKMDDSDHTKKLFFDIRLQKYLEALDKKEHLKAIKIMQNDLNVFSSIDREFFKEITHVLTLEDFREYEHLSGYPWHPQMARRDAFTELKKTIQKLPEIKEKLQFPPIVDDRLRQLINQSLHWQHLPCKNPQYPLEIKTLFADHNCTSPNGSQTSPTQKCLDAPGTILRGGHFPSTPASVIPVPFQPFPQCLPVQPKDDSSSSMLRMLGNPNPPALQAAIASKTLGFLHPSTSASIMERSRSPPLSNVGEINYPFANSDHARKFSRNAGIDQEEDLNKWMLPEVSNPVQDLTSIRS